MTTFNAAFIFFSIFFLPFFPFLGGGGVGGGVNLLTVYLLSELHLLVCSRTCPS